VTALISNVIIDVVLAVLQKLWMKRQTHDSFELARRGFVAQVDEQLFAIRRKVPVAFLKTPDTTRFLFDHKVLARRSRTGDNAYGMIESHLL